MKYKPEYVFKEKKPLSSSKILYNIENRPHEINNRSTLAHLKTDNVIASKKRNTSIFLTFTKTKTRF